MPLTDAAPAPVGDAPRTTAPRRRPLTSRLSTGHVVVLLVGLLAAVLNYVVLHERDRTFAVTVAAHDLRPGSEVDLADVRVVDLRIDRSLVGAQVDHEGVEGSFIAANRIAAGDLVRRSDLRAASVPVEQTHAVGGDLVAGDTVDVITVTDGRSWFVATGVEVLAVGDPALAGLASIQQYSVTLALDADEALHVAAAVDAGTIEIVRATGAQPVDAGTAPPASDRATGGDDAAPDDRPGGDGG